MREISITDWKRILLGEAPAEFLVEVSLRTVVIYIALLVALRIMGKRMNGQLSIAEIAVMITLGAIISVPMQIPDRGLLQGLLVLLCALFFHSGLNYLEFRSGRIERITQGRESILVKDGVICMEEIHRNAISKQQLFGVLRSQQIYNLGNVRRVYLEACGVFSVFTFSDPRPGLSLTPSKDRHISAQEQPSEDAGLVCPNCGAAGDVSGDSASCCGNCGHRGYIHAVRI